MLVPLMATAQDNFYFLNGKFKSTGTAGKVYLSYYKDNAESKDSAIVRNGTFEFKGALDEPFNAYITFVRKELPTPKKGKFRDGISIYLDRGVTTMSIDDSISTAAISDSGINSDYNKYQKVIKVKGAEGEMEARLIAYTKQNPDSYFSLEALQEIAGPYFDISKVEPLFNGLSEKVRNSKQGRAFATSIAAIKSTSVGKLAPDFTHLNANDKPIRLADFKGKYVLIDFWASWCGPCRAENPKVLKAYNTFKDKNFTVLGVSVDEHKDKWLKAIKDDGMPWTQLIDSDRSNKNRAGDLYAIKSIPTNFLIDPTGRILAKNLFGEALERKLEEVIK